MRRGVFAIVLAWLLAALVPAIGTAQSAPPPKVVELLDILRDPEVKAWIESQEKQVPPAARPSAETDLRAMGLTLRARFRNIAAALPKAPSAIGDVVARVLDEARDKGLPPPGLIFGGILLAALVGEYLARRLFLNARMASSAFLAQAMGHIGPILVFTLVAAAIFLAVDWPQAFDTVIVHYLVAAVIFRVVVAVHAMAYAAGSLTRHMYRRILAFAAVLLVGLATTGIAQAFNVEPDVLRALAVIVSLVLLAISIETVLRSPEPRPLRSKILAVLGLVALWLLWVSGLHLLFWTMIYAALFPKLLPAVDRLARAFAATRWPDDSETSIPVVLVVRGLRAVVIGLAVGWLFIVWQVNPEAVSNRMTLFDAVFVGLLKSVIVILVADLGWAVAKAAIGRRMLAVKGDDHGGDDDPRRARLRTLLPIFQNALAATLLVVTALMVLAELGVEIGPLIAGAGIFGVAIGFGSQTLVKDVISGVFYLMDDAFRVGEYIQSGSYMGTVESFSLRSVRLRHHRGPVFTVPFGELGAVQNMSRDWVIDKFRIKVHFDTDIARAKKLTKAVGAELLKDEELGPLIIETVKMKGVEQIGEFGIELSFAFTAKPGNQSMIRRRAYVMIRKTFAENGISFAQPTVHVGGGDDKGEAAAGAHLAQMQRTAAQAQQPQPE
jgi:small-conductance mechanosensitive channel